MQPFICALLWYSPSFFRCGTAVFSQGCLRVPNCVRTSYEDCRQPVSFRDGLRYGTVWPRNYVVCLLTISRLEHFWLAVHGKPVLFWKDICGLKIRCFLFYAYSLLSFLCMLIARMQMGVEFRAIPIWLRKLPNIC